MIREVTMYQAVCDRCGEISEQIGYNEEDAADKASFYEQWEEIDGKLYCPDCYEYDEGTDEYKPKKKED